MDVFIEKIVSKKKTAKDYIYYAGVVFLCIVLLFVVIQVSALSTFLQTFWFLFFAGIIYLGWVLIRRKNIEYEYSLTNGDLDIDIIIDKRSRKSLFSKDCREFDIIAPYPEEAGDLQVETKERLEAVSSMDSDDIYFILTKKDNRRIAIFFQPDSRMLQSFKQIIPRNIKLRESDIGIADSKGNDFESDADKA